MESGKRNLIYLALFVNPNYVNLLELLLRSMKLYGSVDLDTTDILILTDESLHPQIEQLGRDMGFPLKFFFLTISTKWEASCARIEIFKYEDISEYDKILYIDTDIIINRPIGTIFDLDIRSDKLYAKAEGQLGSVWWGGQFFNFPHRRTLSTWATSPINERTTAFCAGILFFRNSSEMKLLFGAIGDHINDYIHVKKNPPPQFWDQPFIVYNSFIHDAYDNSVLHNHVVNCEHTIKDKFIIYHFPVGPGNYEAKMLAMTKFAEQQANYHTQHITQHK
jgi:hypothetical protein